MDIPGSFSWALPLLAARLLAAAGIALAVTGCYEIEQKKESLIRSYIVMLAVYLASLVAAILLFHLDRFDWRAAITYAFFAVAGGMTIAALWHLLRGTKQTGCRFSRYDRARSSCDRAIVAIIGCHRQRAVGIRPVCLSVMIAVMLLTRYWGGSLLLRRE